MPTEIPVNEETARSGITIQGVILSVPEPFTEGHVLRANEAATLNQTYQENVRNNYAKTVKAKMDEAAVKAGLVEGDDNGKPKGSYNTEEAAKLLDTDELQRDLDKYVLDYDFGARRAGTPVDPVERQALEIATDHVKEALKKQGYKLTDIGTDRIREMAEKALEDYPVIREKAAQIVELRSNLGVEAVVSQ